MNDEEEPPPSADPAQMRAIARRLILPPAILGAVVVAAALWFVLYGMKGGGSKEASRQASVAAAEDCAASTALAAKLAPLAKGDIAALAIATSSRPMPNLTFSGPAGQVELATFKGKTILLNIWATWCVPCREEMPALDRLQGVAGGDAFAVVAVNIDNVRLDRPKAFLQEIGVKNLSFYVDSTAKSFQSLQQSGKVVGLPTSFLIGRDGCEIGAIAGPAKWDGADALAMIKAATQN